MAAQGLPLDQLARALDATGSLVAGIAEDQWEKPTPCSEWTVRDLVNHVVGGNHVFAGILQGGEFPPPGQAGPPRTADHLGDDPAAAYRQACRVLLDAFGQPGVAEAEFPSPVGTVPGMVLMHLRITEMLVHGWDLARATGQPAALPGDLAELELRFTRGKLADIPPGRHPFGPPQPVSDDAPAVDQLAACLGRRVSPGDAD